MQPARKSLKVLIPTIKRLEAVDSVPTSAQVGTLQSISKAFTDTGKVRFDGVDGVFIK